MADRALERNAAAEAVTQYIGPADLEIIEQPCNIVRKVFSSYIAFDVTRPSVSLQFDGDHLSRFGEFVYPLSPVAGDRHKGTVQHHQRLTGAVNFVVHFQTVDRSIARHRFLLPRRDAREEHDHNRRHHKSCCLHV